MIQGSTENEENNDSPPEYSISTGIAQEQAAILIENELLKAQNEIAMAALTAHIQQEGERRSSSRELTKLMVYLCLKVLSIPVFILFWYVFFFHFIDY